jgi:hypothetical protein
VTREDINQPMNLLWIRFHKKYMIKYCLITLGKKDSGYLQDSKFFRGFTIITGNTKFH